MSWRRRLTTTTIAQSLHLCLPLLISRELPQGGRGKGQMNCRRKHFPLVCSCDNNAARLSSACRPVKGGNRQTETSGATSLVDSSAASHPGLSSQLWQSTPSGRPVRIPSFGVLVGLKFRMRAEPRDLPVMNSSAFNSQVLYTDGLSFSPLLSIAID